MLMPSRLRRLIAAVLVLCLSLGMAPARAERIKELVTLAGVRPNQLVGYGLVVGLDGTGDQTSQAPFTTQGILNMLGNLGVTLPLNTNLQLKNVAAVMVTMELPPFAQPGQQFDVTVSSLANAKSLKGGTLVMTPLKGVDGQVYAVAQGNLIIGGAGAAAGGASVTVNHLSAGRIPAGGLVERAVPTVLGEADWVMYELRQAGFTNAQRVAEAINSFIAPGIAMPLDARRVRVQAPQQISDRVAFLGRIENLEVVPDVDAAKVIVNSRTGSVVMNQAVTLRECAVSHGNLTVSVSTENQVSQPGAFSPGQTVVTQTGQADIKQDNANIVRVRAGANLADVVKALNAVGAKPLDLINILQAMKAAGALRAELEVI